MLNALKNSARNWTVYLPSPKVVFLKTERSQRLVPGVRASGNVRGTLPKVNGGAKEKTEVSNHFAMRSERVPPVRRALSPFVFGRCPGLKRPVLFCPLVIISGVPP